MLLGRARDALLCALMLSTCDAGASPAPVSAPVQAQVGELRPEAYRVASDAPIARARAAFERRAFADALTIATAALGEAQGDDRARLAFVAGRSATELGRSREAIAYFDLVASSHPLAPFAAMEAAELDVPERAIERVRTLREGFAKARRIDARAALAIGRDDAEVVAQAVLASDDLALWSIAMPLAVRLEARGANEEALALYRRVMTRIPRSSLAEAAAPRERALLAALPEEARARLSELPLADAMTRAAALAPGDRGEAIAAYDALLARLPADAAERCDVLGARGRLVAQGRDRAHVAATLTALAETCADADTRAYALFKAARALHQSDHDADALVLYERLATELPAHRLADDAVIYAAAIDREAGRLDAMRARLAAVPERHPQGDMRNEALFLLGFEARGRAAWDEALTRFDAARAIPETTEDTLGRAAYWYARTLADLDRADEARAAYAALVRALPLSFYAQLALARIEATSPELAATLRAELPRGEATPLVFDATDGLDLVAAARVAELLVVGALPEASRELAAMGAFADDAAPTKLWLAASLYEATGHASEAVRLLRRRLETFRTAAPVGTLRTMWRIAYPRAFSPLIEDAATRESVPSALVRAIAREESSFDPDAVSHAHAYGLIQILVPTARGYRRALGMEPTAQSLRDPDVNLRFGTRFMSFLTQRYGTEILVPPAYNAGHGALDRWMRAAPASDFDAFVEQIPYEETRRYTRRVLQSYGVYAWLDEARLPTLPLSLAPRDAAPAEAPAVAKP